MNGPFPAPTAPAPATPPPAAWLRELPSRELRRREVLYRVHDPAETVYRVEEGLLALAFDAPAGRERIVALAGPGDWLGALAPNDRVLRERAVALSDRVVVRVSPRDAGGDALERTLFEATGVRLARWRDALEEVDLPVRARLARVLLRLGERFGQDGDDGLVRLTLPLTHETLAGLLGAARETTTSLVSELRRVGAVEGTRGRYRLHPGRLAEVASIVGHDAA